MLAASLGIVALAAFYHFGMPALLGSTLGLPLLVRAAISTLLIAPLGLLLGIPSRAASRNLSRSREGIVPWAWGVNGALSVSGAVLTRILSTAMGFTTILAVMAALYVIAGLLLPSEHILRERDSRLGAPEKPRLRAPGRALHLRNL